VNALTGVVSFQALLLAAATDVVPPGRGRAAAFGVILSIFMLGIAFSPFVVELLDTPDIAVVAASVWGCVGVPLYMVFFFRETVSPRAAFEAKLRHEDELALSASKASGASPPTPLRAAAGRALAPFRCMKILMRSRLFVVLTALIVFTGMANEASQTMLL
jgi:hypothetical protein